MLMHIFTNIKVFGHRIARKFYFAVFDNCQKHLEDKTNLNCNSFPLNQFSHAVASEIIMKTFCF